MRKIATSLMLMMAITSALGLSGCLDGGGNGGNGGYTITYPVADLILGGEELPDWHVTSLPEPQGGIEGFEDVAAIMITDTESLFEADHLILLTLFEMNSTEEATDVYQIIKDDYSGSAAINQIEVGTEGFWVEVNGTVSILFTKYRYITVMVYEQLGLIPMSINELITIAEEQAEQLVYRE